MVKFLVTGGAGFIGSHIAENLLKGGHEVRILDNFSTGKRENLAGFENAVEVIEGDIRDRGVVEGAVRDVDFVLHQAALASVQRSVDDPVAASEVNIQGTLNLLDAARRASVKRFVYASSSSVYGDGGELPKREDMPVLPKSPYAVTKLAGEWYTRVYSEIYGLPAVSLRYFNVFGPRQDPDSQYSAVIPVFINALLKKTPPTIFGDGEQSRDFTYVENVVAANLLACRAGGSNGGVYNIACGERFTLNALYAALRTITGVELDPRFGPPRPGDVRHSQAAIAAAGRAMGYRPSVGFEEGLRRTVRWYREAGPTR